MCHSPDIGMSGKISTYKRLDLGAKVAVSKRLRFEIFRRDNHTCRYCGRSAPDVKLRPDHVTPVALGGSDDPSNLVTACEDCNNGKSSVAPDSALVAEVADDAIRWARAQAQAADEMLGQFRSNSELAEKFHQRWEYWTNVRNRRAWLDNDWRHSVDSWLTAGLPIDVILDSLDKAMRKDSLRPGDVFKYTCGIAWARVRELRERTAGILATDGDRNGDTTNSSPYCDRHQPDAEFMKGWYAGTQEFAEEILEHFSEEEVAEFIKEGRADAEDDGEELTHTGPDRNDPYMMRLGANQGIERLCARVNAYEYAIDRVLDLLPNGMRSEIEEKARHDFENHGEMTDATDFKRWCLFLVGYQIRDHGIAKGASE